MYLRICFWFLLLLTAALGVQAAFFASDVEPGPARREILFFEDELSLKAMAAAAAAAKAQVPVQVGQKAAALMSGPAAAFDPKDILQVIPVPGPVTSEFGSRVLISFSRPRMHSGVDIKAARGTPVVAAGPGTVAFSGRNGTYGLLVKIDHGNGLSTCYAHMDKSLVQEGEAVEGGEAIGTVGKSGKTTGVNLHFEVRVNDKCIDPRNVFEWPPSPPRKPKPQLP